MTLLQASLAALPITAAAAFLLIRGAAIFNEETKETQ